MDIEKKCVQKRSNQVNKLVNYNDITYYYGLKLQVGRNCCGSPSFMYGSKIKVAHNNLNSQVYEIGFYALVLEQCRRVWGEETSD